jgi:hypothetical protein
MFACKGREALQYFYGDVALFRKRRKMGKGKGKCQNYQGVLVRAVRIVKQSGSKKG